MPRDYKRDDLTGQVFGRLTAESPTKIMGQRWGWTCRCECGKTRAARICDLLSGHVRSCGCLKRDLTRDRLTIHGMAGARVHTIWIGMLKRCESPNEESYPRYGGRGIRVCERWRSFEAFLEDMGEPPSDKHSIDRIDNDGNYEPANCRWATGIEQGRNRCNNRLLEWNDEARTVSEWAEITGIHPNTILHRLGKGWPIERVLGEPARTSATVTHNGITRTITEWSRITGIPRMTLCNRIAKGLPPERVLAVPAADSCQGDG